MKDIQSVLDQFRKGRHEFENGHLEGFEGVNPFELFELWTAEAVESKEKEPNAFVLSTVDTQGQPSSRILYLKDIVEEKYVFYTNYKSQKGDDLQDNDKVSMLFFWPDSSRQVRVQGKCTKAPSDLSDRYFASRPKSSQIGAWASEQSQDLESREDLEKRVLELTEKYQGEVPRPQHWGGYWVEPTEFEFWQGRPSRLHDRIVFTRKSEQWTIRRLNP